MMPLWEAWSDERIERLKTLWAEGHSCSVIAERIGGVSRSAVIGKVHRLGLPGRAPRGNQTKIRVVKAPRVETVAPKPKKVSPLALLPTAPLPKEDPTPAKLVSLLDLTETSCRWPYGDPVAGFCGCQKVPGLPYCESHARRAFTAAQPKEHVHKAPGDEFNRRGIKQKVFA